MIDHKCQLRLWFRYIKIYSVALCLQQPKFNCIWSSDYKLYESWMAFMVWNLFEINKIDNFRMNGRGEYRKKSILSTFSCRNFNDKRCSFFQWKITQNSILFSCSLSNADHWDFLLFSCSQNRHHLTLVSSWNSQTKKKINFGK